MHANTWQVPVCTQNKKRELKDKGPIRRGGGVEDEASKQVKEDMKR